MCGTVDIVVIILLTVFVVIAIRYLYGAFMESVKNNLNRVIDERINYKQLVQKYELDSLREAHFQLTKVVYELNNKKRKSKNPKKI